MDIEEKIFSKKELEKLEELRRKNEVEKINKQNTIEREKNAKKWRENRNAKVLNIGVRVREEFKKMRTSELLSYFKSVRFSWGWDWDGRDEWNHHMEMLELRTELSQREHVPKRKGKDSSREERQRLAKKHKEDRKAKKIF